MEDNRYPGIGSSISGFVFLGTPHRGTGSLTSEGLACAVSRENPDLYIDTSVLQTIKAGSEVTTDLLQEFTSLCSSTMTPICCFFEQQRTKVGRIIQQDLEVVPTDNACTVIEADLSQEVVVDEKSACIDGCLNYGLSVDHFRLNKFANPDDACYRAVAGEIQQFVREAPHRVALGLASIRSGDFPTRLAHSSGMTLASNTSNNNPQASEALQDEKQKTAKPATSPMPVRKLMESLEAIYSPKDPPAAVKSYRSPKTGRHLRGAAYRKGDKVGFKRAYIATWASGEGTYDPYYVCNVRVSMSDKYICMVAPALDGINGEWIVEEELQYYKELEL